MVDGFEFVFDDAGVNLGGLDAAVAKHFQDVTDAGFVTASGNAGEVFPREHPGKD